MNIPPVSQGIDHKFSTCQQKGLRGIRQGCANMKGMEQKLSTGKINTQTTCSHDLNQYISFYFTLVE